MAKVKYAKVGDYVIKREESGAIKVSKVYDNVKGALKEIAGEIGYVVDSSKNTRQLGKEMIEKISGASVPTKEEAYAECGEYVICKEASGSVSVTKNYDNVKGALKEIADKVGLKCDESWNTRQLGSKLIDQING